MAEPKSTSAPMTPPRSERRGERAVERALGELRRGDAVIIHNDAATPPGTAVIAVERATADRLDELKHLSGDDAVMMLTDQRATALDLDDSSPVIALATQGGLDLTTARQLADPTASTVTGLAKATVVDAGDPRIAQAAIQLAKLAHLLPAVIAVTVKQDDVFLFARSNDLVVVSADDVLHHPETALAELTQVGEARVPLADSEETRIVAFRPREGGPEHLAIIVGEPDPREPVLARLHSECFTGDLLGSLRCDCGEQLRGAIREIRRNGGGVVLYLAQEGRGIGLINKLRAYRLQDRGFDTVDANTALGFDPDERLYAPAAAMLRALGYDRVKLMTNNPDKMAQLTKYGIDVAERVRHAFPSNGHNEQYLQTKRDRSGHLL